MRIKPTAMGIEVVPMLKDSSQSAIPGTRAPIPMPMNMAKKIHSVRNLFKNESLLSTLVTIEFILHCLIE
jgi:hypothetical protein